MSAKKICLDLLHVIASCGEDFVGVGTPDPVTAMKVKTKKDALPLIVTAMSDYLETIESTDEDFAIEQMKRMCTAKQIGLELEKSQNDTLRMNLKSIKKVAKYLTVPSMETFLNSLPTEEEILDLLTTIQWPEDQTFPIGFGVSGEEASESEDDDEDEQEQEGEE